MANEVRLINANALVETIVNTPSEVAQLHTYNVLSSLAERQHEILNIIDEQPTVDAVEVAWMPVLGFEGLYEISNLGKVRNHKGETLKQGIKRTNCTCYKLVNLWKDGRYYKKYVHRLIAEAFIPNPDNLPMVNHKDEDGTNNSIDNLEWCTREYNVNYGTAKERRAKKIRGVKHTEEHNKKISESMKRHFAKMDGDGNA